MQRTAHIDGTSALPGDKADELERSKSAFRASSTPATITMTKSNAVAATTRSVALVVVRARTLTLFVEIDNKSNDQNGSNGCHRCTYNSPFIGQAVLSTGSMGIVGTLPYIPQRLDDG